MAKEVFFMKAIIMAGGEGIRLRPLTCGIPKPLVPVADQPVLRRIICLLAEHGIRKIAVTLQYLPGEIKNELKTIDHGELEISCYTETTPLGTAGSVKNCGDFLDEEFVVISGDALTDVDLTDAIRVHRQSGAKATLVVKRVGVPVEYGVVLADSNGQIVGFQEKPSWGEVANNLVNTGIYILSPEVMALCEKDRQTDFAKDIFPEMLRRNMKLMAYETQAYWCDIGDAAAYRKANIDSISGCVRLRLSGMELKPGLFVGKTTIVSGDVQMTPPVYRGDNCYIAHGCVLGGAVIGHGSVLDKGAAVSNSVVWNNVRIGESASVTDSILCDNTDIRYAAVVSNAILGSSVTVGKYAAVKDGAKLWPRVEVCPESVVRSNLKSAGSQQNICYSDRGVTAAGHFTPDFLSRIGCAFGTLKGRGAVIAVSHDGSGTAQMMASALQSGLAATGAAVKVCDEISLPVLRWICRTGVCDGGVHLSARMDGEERETTVRLLNEHGNDLNKAQRQKLKTIFNREDFCIAGEAHILPMSELADPEDYYIADLTALFPSPHKNLGFVGRKFDRSEREAVTACLIAKTYPEAPIFISVASALSAEQAAQKYGCQVIRCGSRIGDMMEEMEKYMHISGVYQQYLMLFDDFAFDLALSQHMPEERFPRVYTCEKTLRCDEERKGEILRHFTEQDPYRGQFEVFDGLYSKSKDGNIRICADEDKPEFHVYVESFDEEYAKDMLSEFSGILENLLQ